MFKSGIPFTGASLQKSGIKAGQGRGASRGILKCRRGGEGVKSEAEKRGWVHLVKQRVPPVTCNIIGSDRTEPHPCITIHEIAAQVHRTLAVAAYEPSPSRLVGSTL